MIPRDIGHISVPTAVLPLVFAWTFLGIQTVHADSIDHSGGFVNHSDLTANGSAKFLGSVAELTDGGFGEAGSIFSNETVHIANFTSTFTFSIRAGIGMADGMTFCIQANGPTALGPAGGGLGYGPDSPGGTPGIPNSVAIKFDIFNNAGEGNNSTGVFSGGRSPTVAQAGGDILIGLDGTGIDLKSQNVLRAELTYHGGELSIAITDTVTGALFSETVSVDIPSKVGSNTANVGFTGGTGGLTSVQDIQTWIFQGGQ